jgi:hypothetical protein
LPRIARIIAFGFGLLGGAIASQAPEFSQQYRQRLGGSIDELRQIVERFETDARANGETRESATARLLSNADDLASRQGAAMQNNADRLVRLEGQQQAMAEAGPFKRIAVMASEGDNYTMQRAYRDFEPAVPLTSEGAVAAASGFAVFWALIMLLMGLLGRVFRPRRRAQPARAA